MRLVEGEHADKVEHTCTAYKWGFCSAYEPGVTRASGATTHVRACMDQYEAPNVAGARPFVMRTATEAMAWCEHSGKRLCTEYEWETACEGPQSIPYGYGWAVDHAVCNTGKTWRPFNAQILVWGTPEASRAETERLWQGEPSGARGACVSPLGIHDMVGNVEEWVTASRYHKDRPQVLAGGHWAKPWASCRDTNFAHEPNYFRFYEVGFRCCADPR